LLLVTIHKAIEGITKMKFKCISLIVLPVKVQATLPQSFT